MTRLILIVTLALAALPLAARPLAASDCTREYAGCLNDAYDLTGALRTMADVECGAAYVGCLGSRLRFW